MKQPTQEDWEKWYRHKSNKERFIEAQEAEALESNLETNL